MKNSIRIILLALAALGAQPRSYADAVLIHRYSFKPSSDSTIKDSIAGPGGDGMLKGEGAYWTNGELTLPGGNAGAYVELPPHLISGLKSVSIEAWVTWTDARLAAAHIFDFGTDHKDRDDGDVGMKSLSLDTRSSRTKRLMFQEFFSVEDELDSAQISGDGPLGLNRRYYLAVTYDPASNRSQLFLNGRPFKSGRAHLALKDLDDVNNWLGRSQWNGPYFKGTYQEFRVWDGVLTHEQVQDHNQTGPDEDLKALQPPR